MGINDSKKEREICMIQVKLFDREHEKDLEKEMNRFLKGIDENELVDIKYNVAAMPEEEEEEQIYCFSAMIIYRA
jgi:Sporulation protein Cse60